MNYIHIDGDRRKPKVNIPYIKRQRKQSIHTKLSTSLIEDPSYIKPKQNNS